MFQCNLDGSGGLSVKEITALLSADAREVRFETGPPSYLIVGLSLERKT